MILRRPSPQRMAESIPRESGDDPGVDDVVDSVGEYSPRERG